MAEGGLSTSDLVCSRLLSAVASIFPYSLPVVNIGRTTVTVSRLCSSGIPDLTAPIDERGGWPASWRPLLDGFARDPSPRVERHHGTLRRSSSASATPRTPPLTRRGAHHMLGFGRRWESGAFRPCFGGSIPNMLWLGAPWTRQ